MGVATAIGAAAAVVGAGAAVKSSMDAKDANKEALRDARDFNATNEAQVNEANQISRDQFDESNRIAKESTDKVNASIDRSNKLALAQRERSLDFIKNANKTTRGDMFKLFPQAQQSRQQGLQAGFDLFNKTVPAQMQAFQQGNVAAQNALLGKGGVQEAVQLNNPLQTMAPVNAPQFAPMDFSGLPKGLEG